MIDVRDPALYAASLAQLRGHKTDVGQRFKGRFILLFFGLKFNQNRLSSIFSGSFFPSEILESLLDELYSKASRDATDCVLMPFEGSYLARTGLIKPGNKYPSNTWRNHFHIQKGIGCYAPKSDLESPTFLDQPRSACRHLLPATEGTLSGARCTLCSEGEYRNEDHRKWLQIDPGKSGFAVVDLQNVSNFQPYVAPEGQRIPFWPFAVAVYHDAFPGLATGMRDTVSRAEFMADFNLSGEEFDAYFDDAATNAHNAAVLGIASTSTQQALRSTPRVLVPQPRRKPVRALNPEALLMPTAVPPPAVNTGWEAEQYVKAALDAAGWNANVVSRYALGYDVFAQKGVRKLYVEVKSSLGLCTPSLTALEWQQASIHTDEYVLAVLENFSPSGMNAVHWIPDPSNRCITTMQHTISYSVARRVWSRATVALDTL
jgi:hypothetical protein